MAALGRESTVGVYFDIVGQGGKDGGGGGAAAQQQGQQQQFFVQFVTTYCTLRGEWRMRTSTITRRWCDGQNLQELAMGFDQEAAAVLVARLCNWKMETEEDFDATRWLDRQLIRLCGRFGEYRKDDPGSFALSPSFAIYPQFMFNLRRSQFVQVFNNSPDETAYFRMVMERENVLNSLVMIQPTLMSYSFNGPPEPVLLDVASIVADRILLLDAYFHVCVYHGTTIAQWQKARYQDNPEHAAFAQLLQAPRADAQAMLATRFPYPRLVVCDHGGSQARFLLARLNPSNTYNNTQFAGSQELIFTDDVSLQVRRRAGGRRPPRRNVLLHASPRWARRCGARSRSTRWPRCFSSAGVPRPPEEALRRVVSMRRWDLCMMGQCTRRSSLSAADARARGEQHPA